MEAGPGRDFPFLGARLEGSEAPVFSFLPGTASRELLPEAPWGAAKEDHRTRSRDLGQGGAPRPQTPMNMNQNIVSKEFLDYSSSWG